MHPYQRGSGSLIARIENSSKSLNSCDSCCSSDSSGSNYKFTNNSNSKVGRQATTATRGGVTQPEAATAEVAPPARAAALVFILAKATTAL